MNEDVTELEAHDFIEFINELEDKINPASCNFKEFNYWPILRFAINYKRNVGKPYLDGDLPPFDEKELHGIRPRLKRLKARLEGDARRGQPPEPTDLYGNDHFDELPQADVLYLNRKGQYVRTLHGHVLQPQTDGLRHAMGPAYGARSLTLADGDPRVLGETFLVPTMMMPAVSPLRPVALIVPRVKAELDARKRILAKVAETNALIETLQLGLTLSPRDVVYRIERTCSHLAYFRALFAKVQPKVVYLSSYTGAYYVCAAAKALGITVVDIQHGGMHRHHPLAANWRRMPCEGYELLPDVFWCWTAKSAGYIDASTNRHHRTVVGGNPKTISERALSTTRAGAPAGTPAEEASGPKRPKVLVALQYGAGRLIEPHVKEAYFETRDRADWHFRLHPLGWEHKDLARAELQIEEAALVRDSQLPLSDMLLEADLVLTNASTIVHEAVEYGAAAAVCTARGAAIFDDLIAAGQISHAATIADILFLMRTLETDRRAGRASAAVASPDANAMRRAFCSLLGPGESLSGAEHS